MLTNHRYLRALVATAAGTTVLIAGFDRAPSTESPHVPPQSPSSAMAHLPSPFVPNLGQWQQPTRFVHRSGPMTMFVDQQGWTLNLVERSPRAEHVDAVDDRSVALRMSFEGAAREAEIEGVDTLPGRHNYLLGSDASRWRTDVPLYAAVRYRGLYPGVDLRLYEADGHPEYDLLLEPDARLAQVSVRVEGAEGLEITDDGSLVIRTALGPVTQPVPLTWQVEDSGEKREIACRYTLLGPDRFGFEVDGWNRALPLTIDPGLVWSTLLGGNGDDYVNHMAVDADGVVTVGGQTSSTNFPAPAGAPGTVYSGGAFDAFVSRLDPSRVGAAQLLSSTFLGGSDNDWVRAVSVDPASGVILLAGATGSSDFPTTPGAFDTTHNGRFDAFVCRFDPTAAGGAQLLYSTFLGGNISDYGSGLSADPAGVITVVGFSFEGTVPSGFPTTPDAYDATHNGGADVFVSRLDPSKPGVAQLLYSTFVGGSDDDRAGSPSVDASGVVTFIGWIASPDYPTTAGAYGTTYSGGEQDVCITRIDPSKTGSAQLLYSTLVGGAGQDVGYHLVVDANGVVTFSGATTSMDFPTTTGAWSETYLGGSWDGYVARLDPSQTGSAQLLYSTFLGGNDVDSVEDLEVDVSGVVTFVGATLSPNFPTTPGAYSTTHGGEIDGFVGRLDPGRIGQEQLLESTLFGASGDDRAHSISVAANGSVTVAGTAGPGFPTTAGAWSPAHRGGAQDGFVARFDMLPTGVSRYGTSSPGCSGELSFGVTSMPREGNAAFALTCDGAPPSAGGVLLITAAPLSNPFVFMGVSLWVGVGVSPSVLLPAASDPNGAAVLPLPIPADPRFVGGTIHTQVVWAGPGAPPPCPPLGLSATGALAITIQP